MTTIEHLYDIYLQHPQVTTDSRNVPPSSLFIALKGERFDGNKYAAAALEAGAAYVVVDDPTIADRIGKKALLVEDGLATLSTLANHHRQQLTMPILAITGSNGKTTTKELAAAVLSQRYITQATRGNLNNHIGLPLTILEIGPEVEMAILEMGANHQREIAHLCSIANPTHGLITNIGEAHLEGFGGIEGVKAGKGELYDFLREHKGIAFVNLDADFLPEMAGHYLTRINYTASETLDPQVAALETKLLSSHPNVAIEFLDENNQPIVAETNLPGLHNYENIKAAVALGKYFKVKGQDIKTALEGYLPDNNRSERKTVRNVNFWLDAYNANPSSVSASLSSFSSAELEKRVVVLGDMLELGEATEAAHLRIARYVTLLPVATTILVGPAYATAASELGITHFPDVAALAAWFWQQDWSDATVLLKGSRGVGLERLLAL